MVGLESHLERFLERINLEVARREEENLSECHG
jgi:hypothetical protein